MEEGLELKFVSKKYRCGKSLDGLMKTHVAAAKSAESEVENVGDGNQTLLNENRQLFGYGLRENPKKTRRAFDSILSLSQDNVCEQCGKGFVSLKAFWDHVAASHCETLKVDCSWIEENQKIVCESELRTESSKSKMSKRVGVNSPLNGSSSVSDIDVLEQEELAICLMILSRDSWNKGGVNSVIESSDNDSLVMEAKVEGPFNIRKQSEAEEIKLKGTISNYETEDSDSGYFLGECTKAESDASVDRFRMNDALSQFKKTIFSTKERGIKEFEAGFGNGKNLKSKRSFRAKLSSKSAKGFEQVEYGTTSGFVRNESRKRDLHSQKNSSTQNAPKRSKFECFDCKKTFKSFQALGGHRPCHKRPTMYESDDSSDHTTYHTKQQQVESGLIKRKQPSASSSQKKVKSKKSNKPHVCPFCSRVFKNGHALGGHKRSHFLGGNEKQSPVIQCDRASGLLDLNLPPPEADDDLNGKFFTR